MKIDINAFMDSLPIMGVGLLGIFIVTIILIVGIYFLRAVTSGSGDSEEASNGEDIKKTDSSDTPKESAMDLMKEREKKDFLEEEECNYISHDL
ncbi:MAG: hypothetical protein K5865_04790 [Eubacterium sp.]|nr:hypothetical protein [Eubacterium sp.]